MRPFALEAAAGGGAVPFPAESGVLCYVYVLGGLVVAGFCGQHEGVVHLRADGEQLSGEGGGTHGEELGVHGAQHFHHMGAALEFPRGAVGHVSIDGLRGLGGLRGFGFALGLCTRSEGLLDCVRDRFGHAGLQLRERLLEAVQARGVGGWTRSSGVSWAVRREPSE